ncbi:MAG: hypothetical protein V7459_03640 [Oceanicoccus sp.]
MTNNVLDVDDFLDSYRKNQPIIPKCEQEADWYRYWQSAEMNHLDPALMALKGGIHAPNLAYVFISGYQAAMRHVFPEIPDNGWTAFAASEDSQNPDQNPPLVATNTADTIILTGTKSWVAQSKSVDYLIVTAKSVTNGRVMILVKTAQKGLELSHRDAPSFLADMSQGFARFSEVAVEKNAIIPGERLKTFMKSESKFIMLALSGWFYSQSLINQLTLADNFKALATDYFSVCRDNAVKVTTLAALDTRLQSLFNEFSNQSDISTIANWQGDRALVSTYSKGIQTRAAKIGNN